MTGTETAQIMSAAALLLNATVGAMAAWGVWISKRNSAAIAEVKTTVTKVSDGMKTALDAANREASEAKGRDDQRASQELKEAKKASAHIPTESESDQQARRSRADKAGVKI